jgi:hypothetical protein
VPVGVLAMSQEHTVLARGPVLAWVLAQALVLAAVVAVTVTSGTGTASPLWWVTL